MNIPGLEAIDNIRVGSSRVPMDQRPRWIDANPYELMDFTNSACRTNTNYEQSQRLDMGWTNGNGPDPCLSALRVRGRQIEDGPGEPSGRPAHDEPGTTR